MKFKSWFCYFLLIIHISSGSAEINQTQTVDFISDYINNLESPSFVSAFLCLTQENLMNLYKNVLLHGKYFSLAIYKSFDSTSYKNLFNDQIEECQKLLIVDMRCNSSMNFIQHSDPRFPSPLHWLLLEENLDDEVTALRFRNFSFFINSDVKLARNQNDSFIINPIYKITTNDSLIIEDYETIWSTQGSQGKFVQKQKYKTLYERRSNLHKAPITVSFVVMDNDTFDHLTDFKNLAIDPSTKKNYLYMQHVTKFLNATFKFIHANIWGTQAENYTIGILGHVVRGEADLSGNGLLLLSNEVHLLLYLVPVGETSLSFVFRQPTLTYTDDVFKLSFETALWVATFITIVILGIILFCVVYWEWIFYKRTEDSGNFIEVLTIALTTLCQQGSKFEPQRLSEHLVLLVTFVATTFIYTAYSANIIVLLQTPSNAIKTLDDLLNSKMYIGMEDTTYNYYYFQHTHPKLRLFWDKKISPPGDKPHAYQPREGIQKVRQGYFAYGVIIGTAYRLINEIFEEHEKCGVNAISYLDLKHLWLSAPKNTTYGELFKTIFRKMYERGIMQQGRLKIFAAKPKCNGGKQNMFVTVTLEDVSTAFFVLGFGTGLSLIILMFEIFYKKYKDKKFDYKTS